MIKDDHIVIKERFFSWKEVCVDLTKRESPLIDYKSISKLDCMGSIVNIIDFCDKKEAANPYFTRAIVEKSKKRIICQSSRRVILKWQCEGKNDRYCKDIEIGCFLFKERLAKRLKLAHKSIILDATGKKILNCYFDTQVNSMELN